MTNFNSQAAANLADLATPPGAGAYGHQRQQMVHQQLMGRGITDARVLEAMLEVPRHCFVPPSEVRCAYWDQPLPTSQGQTISQPYIVAFMTDIAAIPAQGRVLEVGTGSGYQAAILAKLATTVYSIEIIDSLARQAQQTLAELGYENIHIKQGNGYQGWPEHAPYDAILVTAAPTRVPSALVDQLAMGGKLVVPVGYSSQTILVITRHLTGVSTEYTIPVRFVPMIGEEPGEGPVPTAGANPGQGMA
ncbi:MAG: protein-L-isoaspartate(D-aspartate) O-methyltransferase [Cyanobacteria bacterium REEB459]|nr:protein-L-isoaspartate(D-aspartate) O-methyltransferase [Cyanobacteria bacterium REEB459]